MSPRGNDVTGEKRKDGMIEGGCLCGAVRYRSRQPALFGMLCHCRDCQRASGAGHLPVMGVRKSGFEIGGATRGYARRGGSGRQATRHFCPHCGSLLFGTTDAAPDVVTIYAGTLDEPDLFRPTSTIFTRDRCGWDHPAEPLQEFATLPALG